MKNIEEINKAHVKKILGSKKFSPKLNKLLINCEKKTSKNNDFQHPRTPLDRALAAARARFSLFDKMCLWHPFGSHFGGVLSAQMEAKAIKKPLQESIKKNNAQNEPKLVPKGVPKWSQKVPQKGVR